MGFDFSKVEQEFYRALNEVEADPGYMLELIEASDRRKAFSRVVDSED